MSKIYVKEQVQHRIDEIDVREVIGVEFQITIYRPTYKETFTHPNFRKGAWIGCTLMAF
jgi:hypothetical protein